MCGMNFRDGIIHDIVFLDNGVLQKKASSIGGITDDSMLKLLSNSEGFQKLIHSIGITVESAVNEQVLFDFKMYGKKDRLQGGSSFSLLCTCDGTEQLLSLEDYKATKEDDVPGAFEFRFKEAGKAARISIRFFLKDGYTAPNLGIDPPVDFSTEDYSRMIEKSLLNLGNVKRIQDVVNRAKKGEEVTIAYIGGSITQGAGAKPGQQESYTYKSYTAFRGICGEHRKVRYIQAGVGGTPSELGMLRYDRDVRMEKTVDPDIVIVEFAVNDAGDETEGNCFESLVYHILSAPNHPAVILLFSVFENDWNLQERLAPVGYRYDIPMVSIKDAVVEQFYKKKGDGNIITKRQFFYDIFHPTNEGHTIMADCLTYLFRKVLQAEPAAADINLNQLPVIGRDFVSVQLSDRKNPSDNIIVEEGGFTSWDEDLQIKEVDAKTGVKKLFPYNWMRIPENGEAPMRLKVKCKAFLLIYKDSGADEFGKASVSVDGKAVRIFDPHEIGWTHCTPVILIQEAKENWHDITIRMENGEENKKFTVLGFGIVN